jgi:nicotinate-nucleotide adenylyltransferase
MANNEEQATRVGIFGGTFAPIHNGHVEAARLFMEQMRLDYLFVIPAAIPPHKQIDDSDSPYHRLKMCELAFSEFDGVVVSDMEIARGGKSYTIDTIRELTAENRRLLLFCGTDMVLTFDQWRQYKEILSLCYPVYMRREHDRIIDDLVVKKITQYYQETGKMFRRIVGEPIEISSSEIRAALKQGKDISDMVPKAVAEYIKENNLYT